MARAGGKDVAPAREVAGADGNIFNLADKAPAGQLRAQPVRTWTEEEIAEKLSGYIEVPPAHYDMVRAGSHIRYYTRADGFRPGGFVAKNPTDAAPQGANSEKRYIRLQSGYNERAPGYFSWVVAYEDLTKLFIKPDAASLTVMASLESAVGQLNKNIRKIADFAKSLDARLTALEERRGK